MKPLHTTGPWTSREPLPEPFLVRGDGREWLTFDWHIHGAGGQLIGRVEFNTSGLGCPRVSSIEEARANMRLVVAGPEMLAALEGVVPRMPARDARCHQGIVPQSECANCQGIARAIAVIAKARGAA